MCIFLISEFMQSALYAAIVKSEENVKNDGKMSDTNEHYKSTDA